MKSNHVSSAAWAMEPAGGSARRYGYASATFSSGLPSAQRARLLANALATRRPWPSDAAALCEITNTLGKSQKPESGGSGST